MELGWDYIDRGGWITCVEWGMCLDSGRCERSGIYGWEWGWQIWMKLMTHFLELWGGTKLRVWFRNWGRSITPQSDYVHSLVDKKVLDQGNTAN